MVGSFARFPDGQTKPRIEGKTTAFDDQRLSPVLGYEV